MAVNQSSEVFIKILTLPIPKDIAEKTIWFMNDHIEFLLKESDLGVSECQRLIRLVQEGEISSGSASVLRMYLEFRKHQLILAGNHSFEVIKSIRDLDGLIDFYGQSENAYK